ncbi:hypothetical protein [Demequina sp.]|uniref:hypothetical protein n=1 Tax=Demequina sp. TaxID=2050685 RepID=UPI0025C4D56D|nr:hypothetical protein [Demequina sp.]
MRAPPPTRQSVQRVADALAADGLVAAKPEPDHKTAPLLATSPMGQKVPAQLVAASDKDRGARLSCTDVTAQELAAARATVRKVLGALAD